MKKKKQLDTLIIGGLHVDDFEWASRQHTESGYTIIGFLLDIDGYHWKAIYLKAHQLQKALEVSIFGSKYP